MDTRLNEKIKELRLKAKLSQKALGEQLGISDRAVSNWENGLSLPSTKNLLLLSRIFHVSPDVLCAPAPSSASPLVPPCAGMESLTELYRIGRGPSSSHTLGPEKACKLFAARHPDADAFRAVLYGSLARTGKGHGTDGVIRKTLSPHPVTIDFNFDENAVPHPNTFDLVALRNGTELGSVRVISVGGGKIRIEGEKEPQTNYVYRLTTFEAIAAYCKQKGIRLWQYVEENESPSFRGYMTQVWEQMKCSIKEGLDADGFLPGGLEVHRRAKQLFEREHMDESAETRENRLVSAYAFAVGEQNAAGEVIVTAPTCGAAGVVPAVLYYEMQKRGYEEERIIRALETAGLIGNLIKTNGSISGAECGCQAEIGSACAMAAAALGELFEFGTEKIEYAAEISIEHHLGLTCDPICGLVQIPCIERNAVAAMRAINAVSIAGFLSDSRKISFDNIVTVMRKTGLDISNRYKETAEAGMATLLL